MDTKTVIASIREVQKNLLHAYHLKRIGNLTLYYWERNGRAAIFYRKKGEKLTYLSANPKVVEEFVMNVSPKINVSQ